MDVPLAPVTPPSRGLPTFGYSGAESTGAELREVLSTLTQQCEAQHAGFQHIFSTSWDQAAMRVSQLVIVPETSSWARSRHRKVEGPQPQRDANWPWGLPWLSPRDREAVDSANEDLRRYMELMNFSVRHAPSSHLLFIHPEDLGRADRGEPASVWQLPELRAWANRWGLRRYGTHQCRFGQSDWPFPIGVLSSHPLPHSHFTPGWPTFDDNKRYVGPVSRFCNCPPGTHRRDADYDQRRLRSSNSSILQPGFQQFLSLSFLQGAHSDISAAKLWRKGVSGELVRAVTSAREEDFTDAEEAPMDATLNGLPWSESDSAASRSALDTRALQALGIQDFIFDQNDAMKDQKNNIGVWGHGSEPLDKNKKKWGFGGGGPGNSTPHP